MCIPVYVLPKSTNTDVGADMCRAILLSGTSMLERNVLSLGVQLPFIAPAGLAHLTGRDSCMYIVTIFLLLFSWASIGVL